MTELNSEAGKGITKNTKVKSYWMIKSEEITAEVIIIIEGSTIFLNQVTLLSHDR